MRGWKRQRAGAVVLVTVAQMRWGFDIGNDGEGDGLGGYAPEPVGGEI